LTSVVQIDCPDSCQFWRGQRLLVCWLCLALNSILFSPAFACKYTVRDVAFVEMGHSWHRIYLYFDAETPADYAAELRAGIELALTDSNVNLEVMTIGKNATDSSLAHLRTLGIDSHPSAVLVSPDGHIRQVLLPSQISPDTPPAGQGRPETVRQTIQQTIDSVIRSPRRSEILSQLMTAHSVVLIIESDDQAQNLLAKTMAENAIDRIAATLPDLPKPINVPPQLMIISAEEARREAIMLWSLDIDVDKHDATQIAMVFGRGRKLGSVMEVGEIVEQDLLRTLAVVGLDCECDLDRSWMQTPMFPHVWTEADESLAVKSLGFDPGHPLVKVEISRILSRGPSSLDGNRQANSSATADVLLPGLQIIELDFDDDELNLDTEKKAGGGEGGSKTGASALSGSDRETVGSSSADDNGASRIAAADGDPPEQGQRESTAAGTIAETTADTSTSSTTLVVSATLLGLGLLGLLGGALVVFFGRRSGP